MLKTLVTDEPWPVIEPLLVGIVHYEIILEVD